MSSGVSDHEQLREETPTTYYEETLKIPGYGEAPNRCRPMKPVGACERGHVVLGRSSCGTRYCPDHWRDWDEDAVVSIVARLAAYRYVAEGRGKRLNHVVASPPQDRQYSVREVWETRSEAYDAVESAGVPGGVSVTHPYRTTEAANEMYRTAATEGDLDDGTGRWKFLRDVCDEYDELKEFIEPSPHYHILGPGRDVDGSKAPDGWVVERIRTFSPLYVFPDEVPPYLLLDENNKIEKGPQEVVQEGFEDMAATAYYILSHGAVQDGRATTTYFGEVHPNAFNPEEELDPETWGQIQRQAEKAVKEEPVEEEGESVGHGPEECPRDGCEAGVFDIFYLSERLEDDDFVGRVLACRDGRARLAQLRGAVAWWEERTDRPPPGAMVSEKKMLLWLERRGEVFTPEPSQVSLETAVM